MKTTKPKYAPIDATVAGIPEAEPVFLLRAQDKHAAAALRFYADRVQADGGDPNVVAATRQSITDFSAWPVKKAPDLYAPEPAGATEEPPKVKRREATDGETANILKSEGIKVGDVIGLQDGDHRIVELSSNRVVVEPIYHEQTSAEKGKKGRNKGSAAA